MGYGELVKARHNHGVKYVIGSAGGSGSNAVFDMSTRIIKELFKENVSRPMKVISVYAELLNYLVCLRLAGGLVSSCIGGVPGLQKEDVDDAINIVAQMGIKPYVKASRKPPMSISS
ncbi:uncharacterized protein HMPREF1541_05432 [Cyphellophora europaea CBS 101466]|uniref:Uncharacterized protein n=1 Tax=Cyphellophora europaea (strain CBS 101466) TaxID=1220924 RepID=W2RU08_CYPE1|nr:uncharacterized protein HMPREF1541_05432 [Cyphellophora europaea CBS 101466]ETN39209.1 hypothetical protein HMPREF1541_05432 [Cyphellophora europaea CBS 101466]